MAQFFAQTEISRVQRRHRIWIALSLLSAVILGASADGIPVHLIGATGAALLYAAGIRRGSSSGSVATWNVIGGIAGAALIALAAGLALTRPPGSSAWPAALPAAAVLLAAGAALLRHYLIVPNRATRAAAAVAALLLAVESAVILAPTFFAARPAASFTAILAGWTVLTLALVVTEQVWRRWIRNAPPRRTRLSVLMICRDEADRIEQCLRPLADWADEIVVLDSGSTDGTVDIARRYTDRVFETDWAGYGRQKQRALELCRGEWVLNLDADEYIQPNLKREIDAWLGAATGHAAFRICWVSRVFGKPVFFGADGRYHKRLFRREGARFNDADVHEDIIVDGRVARLGAPVVHDTFRDYAHLKRKFTDYALISAAGGRAHAGATGPVLALLRALLSFLLLYVRRLGALDGRRGLLMAVTYAGYTFDKYAAAWTARQK